MPDFKGFIIYDKKTKKEVSYDELVERHCPDNYVPALFDKGELCIDSFGGVVLIGNCDEVAYIPMGEYYVEIPQCDDCPVLIGEDAERFISEMKRRERGEFTEKELRWRNHMREFEKEWKKHHNGKWL